jgi:hypothetical protein
VLSLATGEGCPLCEDGSITGCPMSQSEAGSQGLLYEDSDGNPWTSTKCLCEFEVFDVIMNMVVEALAQLNSIICETFLNAFTLVVQAGQF